MRQRLRQSDIELAPERAMAELARLQRHQIHLGAAAQPVTGISRSSDMQDRVFTALGLKQPTAPSRLALL